jgi:hypothetical protein
MANIDGGHYFLTTLIPLRLEPQPNGDGGFTSPTHLLREALACLPTAQQSPACVAAGLHSPFSRCTRTHFARAFVIDQPMFNGRDRDNALRQGLRNVNLLAHQPVDRLSRPYLMFCADFDARASEADGGLASWALGLWSVMEPELRAVFVFCLGWEAVSDGASFAAWLKRCQIDTTMSFNDYYVPMPDLQGSTTSGVVTRVAGIALALSAAAVWALLASTHSLWWLLLLVPLAALVSLAIVLWMLWVRGSQPYPSGPGADLPSVLKALHVQQRFALLAAELQAIDETSLHARFGRFIDEVRPADLAGPTQAPGVIRSDGTPLVEHLVTARRTAAA